MTENPGNPSHKINPLEQLLADLRERLAKVQRWANDHEREITAVVQGLIVWSRIQTQITAIARRFEGSEWEYLLDRVDFATGTTLLLALDQDGTDGLARLLEEALGHPSALPSLLKPLQATDIPSPHRRQLVEGLRHLTNRDYELAVPLLMIPFEGIVQLRARDRGLIEPHKGKKHRFTEQAGKKGYVGGIEDLLAIDDAGFDQAFADFLVLHVYGGTGDAYRHGLATDGFRQRALMLTVALLGWLSAIAPPDLRLEPLRTLLFKVGSQGWIRLLDFTPQSASKQDGLSEASA